MKTNRILLSLVIGALIGAIVGFKADFGTNVSASIAAFIAATLVSLLVCWKMGDVLVVTVTPDRFVDKGPGRPVFDQGLRAESIAALESVDYVAVNCWPTAEETLRLLLPNYYVKGQEFEKLQDKTGKIQKEVEVVKEIKAEMRFTHEIVFSSSKLIKEHFSG